MTPEWHYTKDGASQGPVTAAQLKHLATAGKIQPTDLIWKEGMANWVPATSIKGLFPASGPPPATPPPPPPPAPATSHPVAAVPTPYASGPPRGAVAVVAGPPPAPPGAAGGSFLVKAKTVWSGWSTPIKVIVVCGAVGLLLMCFMVPLLIIIAIASTPTPRPLPDYPGKVFPSKDAPPPDFPSKPGD